MLVDNEDGRGGNWIASADDGKGADAAIGVETKDPHSAYAVGLSVFRGEGAWGGAATVVFGSADVSDYDSVSAYFKADQEFEVRGPG